MEARSPLALFPTREARNRRRCKPMLRNLPPICSISSLFGRSPDYSKPKPRSNPPPTDRRFEFAIDMEEIAENASAKLRRIRRSTEGRLRRYISSGKEAFHDLRTSVRVEGDRRIVFSCEKSSILFLADFVLWSIVAVVSARVMIWSMTWLRRTWGFGNWVVVRRDRSLGGREVVVGRRQKGLETTWRREGRLANPLSPVNEKERRKTVPTVVRVVPEENLPEWWPVPASNSSMAVLRKEEFQREANRLVRAITDNRMSGKDYKEDDMIQLRQICRTSGVKVSFDTVNSRDSFYRASVEFILKACYRAPDPTSKVQIDGENIRNFIAGLAGDIGIGNTHAIRILRGAVAAKTRSHVLQAWALEVQGRRQEAEDELGKLCRIFWIFPLENHSAEMEMVAVGLQKILTMEQRVHLLNLFGQACGSENRITPAAALGLNNLTETRPNGDNSMRV
ncbi:phosphoribosylformylglycinamidine synthase [Wolffia australiana]